MKAVRTHIREDWILLYVERWLTAQFEAEDGTRVLRQSGTPQGGVVSPLLMNLFMHYAFDYWMKRDYPQCLFARYADDAVVHCRSQKQAEAMMQFIASRLEECGLTIHPEKSKILYCKHSRRAGTYPNVQFTFLEFTFRPRKALNKQNQPFTSFLPGASDDALKRMRQTVRGWKLHRQTSVKLADLAQQYNPTIRGWLQYYGTFYRTAMHELSQYIDRKLGQWARRKYKTLLKRKQRSEEWLIKMKKAVPLMFYHWSVEGMVG